MELNFMIVFFLLVLEYFYFILISQLMLRIAQTHTYIFVSCKNNS